VLWVSVIASLGYLFGKHWEALVDLVQDANLAIAVVVVFWSGFLVAAAKKVILSSGRVFHGSYSYLNLEAESWLAMKSRA